ncbi:DUF3332 domain-containing protein [Geomonas sp. Red32]|uniref:DUF3332 domain-containing protein n=1 Tax=Geomonas sp. Red32 TaxID=2912856 RepID=UPI00202CD7B5|nr:DUF3332 domain-containing protein [Geomonas sp. Red32]MCM0083533.1 DUF3332 domain-containing protein [Geomonas sp. Red32]
MNRMISLTLALAIAMTSLQGCYGKFALTRKVYQVNGEVQDKFLRSLVTWVFIIVPVYGVSALADFVVFNTIEFWSGKNPVAEGEKEFQYTDKADTYHVKATKHGDQVSYLIDHYRSGSHVDTMAINWNAKSGQSQATLDQHGKITDFLAFVEKGGVRVQSGTGMAANEATDTFYR